jgi:hypothetical protein
MKLAMFGTPKSVRVLGRRRLFHATGLSVFTRIENILYQLPLATPLGCPIFLPACFLADTCSRLIAETLIVQRQVERFADGVVHDDVGIAWVPIRIFVVFVK